MKRAFWGLIFLSLGISSSAQQSNVITQKSLAVTTTFSSNGSYEWEWNEQKGRLQSTNQYKHSTTSQTTITIVMPRDGKISFNYEVSSESGYDKMTILLDNASIINGISGEKDGTYLNDLASGSHSLVLKYQKDSDDNDNDDRAYLSNLKLTYDTPNNVIHYTSTSGYSYTIDHYTIKSNTYVNGLGELTFSSALTSVPVGLFRVTSTSRMLSGVKLPDSITRIETDAFYGCRNLTEVEFSQNLEEIEMFAFQDCGMETIELPSTLTSIKMGAFVRCHNLKKIFIPENVESIGGEVFGECENLEKITVDPRNTFYDSRENCNGIVNTATNTLVTACNYTTIPQSVISIGSYAFYGSGIETLIIPDNITSIASNAFGFCQSLTSLSIPSSVSSIGSSAFSQCTSLSDLYVYWENPLAVANGTFSHQSNVTLHVPAGTKSLYQSRPVWKDFGAFDDPYRIAEIIDGLEYANNTTTLANELSYTRNFTNTKWQSLYVPFTMTYEDWKEDFDVAYINSVRQYDNDEDGTVDETIMDVIQITGGELYPNMPYLIRAKSTGEKTIALQDATLYKTEENSIECSTMLSTFTFTGTYSTIPAATLQANGYYAMGGGGLIMTNGTSSLKPFRWYLDITSRSPMYNTTIHNPSRIGIHVIGEEDGMETRIYEVAREEELDAQIFNLNGQKMGSMENLAPGVYVKNGKKFIVK